MALRARLDHHYRQPMRERFCLESCGARRDARRRPGRQRAGQSGVAYSSGAVMRRPALNAAPIMHRRTARALSKLCGTVPSGDAIRWAIMKSSAMVF